MRPVNLLPEDVRPRRASGKLAGSSYAVVGVLAALLLMVVAYVLSSNQVNSRTGEIAEVKQETADAQARLAELAPYERFAQIKATRIASVKDLADKRFDWERMMREVALVLPAGTALTDLSAATTGETSTAAAPAAPAADGTIAASGPSVNLKGCAKRQPEVATLMVRLRRLYRVADVTLNESTKQDSGATAAPSPLEGAGAAVEGCPADTYLFDVTATFSAPEPEDKPKSVPARLGGGA